MVQIRRIALILVKVVVTLLSSAALLLFLFGVIPWVLTGLRNGSNLPTWYIYSLVFPFVYLPFCIISCTKLLKGRTLVVSGVFMHLALVHWIIVAVLNTRYTNIETIFITIAGLWIILVTLRLTGGDAQDNFRG